MTDYAPVPHAPIDYSLIPEHCRHGIEGYLERGEGIGGFLTAIFENDLVGAYNKADDENSRRIRDYAEFLWMHAPSPAWGSRAKVQAWQERGGLAGRPDKVSDPRKDAKPPFVDDGYNHPNDRSGAKTEYSGEARA